MSSNEPSQTNGSGNKPPPYPVEGANMVIEPPAPDPYTADLVSAVQYGYYDRVVELIEPEPHLASTPVNDNITLLHWAAINNRVEIAKYLISKQAQVDVSGGELHSTPLHWAVRDGKLKMVVFLLSQNAQPSLFDAEGFSSIHLASVFGHTEIVAYLIAKGEDVDLIDKNGMTPLMHAAKRIRNREPTQLLIRLGAQVNYQNPINKFTALHYATQESNMDAIKILIDAGAKTDLRNCDNETPFEVAQRRPIHQHIDSLLLSRRDVNPHVPKFLQFNSSSRRLGTKILPYIILIIVALILQFNLSLLLKFLLIVALFFITRGYITIFFDHNMDRYLPIAIAQASIFWLYASYLYYFLPYIHVISWNFFFLVIFTYFSWKNYYLSQKTDPGIIMNNSQEQKFRTIVELIEQNSLDIENFCVTCLVRRPMRSKHCRECDKCIAKFDHHCPWIDNCVGEKNLRYFTGFLFFTPLCLYLYLHGAYLYYHERCNLFNSESFVDGFKKLIHCSPAVLWFTSIAILHASWITGLCLSILYQVATGYTTNEKFNAWRYRYLKHQSYSPFSLGFIQNLIDLIDRRILWYVPVHVDWTRIYTLDDFYKAIPSRIRQKLNSSAGNSSINSFNV